MSNTVAGRKEKRGAPRLGLSLAIGLVIFLIVHASFLDLALASGRSMLPGVSEGDIVLILKAAYGFRLPGIGYLVIWARPRNRDIVAALRPGKGNLVLKRVSGEKESQGLMDPVFLMGDNFYESVDSREYGAVPMNNILGRAFPISRP